MAEGKKKKKWADRIDDAVDDLKDFGEDIRGELKDQDGIAVKSAAALLAPLHKDAQKNLVEAHKSLIKAGKVMVDDYLEAVDNLLKEVS